jgi:hypothetical protein
VCDIAQGISAAAGTLDRMGLPMKCGGQQQQVAEQGLTIIGEVSISSAAVTLFLNSGIN